MTSNSATREGNVSVISKVRRTSVFKEGVRFSEQEAGSKSTNFPFCEVERIVLKG
jgi:hypothetical protein